jgi:hypothetical protein
MLVIGSGFAPAGFFTLQLTWYNYAGFGYGLHLLRPSSWIIVTLTFIVLGITVWMVLSKAANKEGGRRAILLLIGLSLLIFISVDIGLGAFAAGSWPAIIGLIVAGAGIVHSAQ